MADYECPVCGNKRGIPDYHIQDTKCGQCDSDLSIYRVVHELESAANHTDGNRKGKRWIWIIPAIIACCFAGGLLWSIHDRGNIEKDLDTAQRENAILQTRIAELQHAQDAQGTDTAPEVSHFVYTVRKGDSFWLISKKLYGTGSRYREIAESNGMTVESRLNVGDKLIIK